jgi:hypothetical protein
MDTQTLTQAQIVQTFQTWQPLALGEVGATRLATGAPSQGVAETANIKVDPDILLILTAELLGWPVTLAKIREQAGRFAVVEYTPVRGADPDILLALDISPQVTAFHTAVRAFQDGRRAKNLDPGQWYRSMKPVAQKLAEPLWRLNPTRTEANFVIRWVLLTVAKGARINDGVGVATPRKVVAEQPHDDPYHGLPPWAGWVEGG